MSFRPDPQDVTAGAGLALIGVGVGLVSIAAALTVVGSLIFLLAVLPPLIRRGGR